MKKKTKRNNNWTAVQVSEWERIRANGKDRFFASRSASYFALLLLGQMLNYGFAKVLTNVAGLIIIVLFAIAGGLLSAFWSWELSEASYYKALLSEEKRDAFDYKVYAAQQRIAGWEKIKAKGLKRYILTRGCAFVVFFFGFSIVNNSMQRNVLGYESFWAFAKDLAVGCAVGVVSACFYWHIGEDFYRKALETESKGAEVGNTSNAAKA